MTPKTARGAFFAAVGTLLWVTVAACGHQEGSVGRFDPATDGSLVVASAFVPSPGFWEGTAAHPTGGFEYALAQELARRFDLDVQVVEVPFQDLVAGDLGGADMAISQLTPTADREQRLDFSTPYLSAPPGVLVRRGVEAADLHALRRLDWVVVESSTLTDLVDEQVRPEREPLVVESRADALAAIRDGQADVMLLDLPVALGEALDRPQDLEVVAQLSRDEGLAIALPNSSDNRTAVDSAIRALLADGTIDRLSTRWLGTKISTGADDIPRIRTRI